VFRDYKTYISIRKERRASGQRVTETYGVGLGDEKALFSLQRHFDLIL
jgi:hypothetical protein